MSFWPLCCKSELFCQKVSSWSPGLECSYGKIFIPVTEISVAKTEIWVTGQVRPLILTQRNLNEGKSGEARSRKPSQLGWPGSYEEALVTFLLVSLWRVFSYHDPVSFSKLRAILRRVTWIKVHIYLHHFVNVTIMQFILLQEQWKRKKKTNKFGGKSSQLNKLKTSIIQYILHVFFYWSWDSR